MEAVTAVLLERDREAARLTPMVTWSFVLHVAVTALLILGPGRWLTRTQKTPATVMTISLGGGPPGPNTGGMTPLSAKAVQAVAPAPDIAKRAPVTPPAPKAPEMVLPNKAGKTLPKNVAKTAPDDAKGRTQTKGEETRGGTAATDTGSKYTALGGLSSPGGLGGVGSYLDVGSFCCPEYLQTMHDLIQRNWNEHQGVRTQNMVKFTIQRDGTLTDIEVEQSSGNAIVDLASKRALLLTAKLPPLPQAFTNQILTVHLRFEYQ